MSTVNEPVADAEALREAARGLAHATRQIEDARAIYSVIGSLSTSLGSMAQVLHQIGATHDQMPNQGRHALVGPNARAASYQVAWELHRAAEMLTQVGAGVDRAHQLEAAITYDVHLPVMPARTAHRETGLSL